MLFRFHRIIRHASFILWFRFMFLSGTSQLLDRFMGCGRYHPSPHITDPNWTVLCAIFVLWDESNIFRGYCVVFRFSLELLGQASPLVRFRISFSWISLSRMAASIGSMGVLGHVSATNIIVISFICGHAALMVLLSRRFVSLLGTPLPLIARYRLMRDVTRRELLSD